MTRTMQLPPETSPDAVVGVTIERALRQAAKRRARGEGDVVAVVELEGDSDDLMVRVGFPTRDDFRGYLEARCAAPRSIEMLLALRAEPGITLAILLEGGVGLQQVVADAMTSPGGTA